MCFLQTFYFENFQDYRKKKRKKKVQWLSIYPAASRQWWHLLSSPFCSLSFPPASLLYFHLFLLFFLCWLLLPSPLPFFSFESCENKLQRSLNYFWSAGVPRIWKVDIVTVVSGKSSWKGMNTLWDYCSLTPSLTWPLCHGIETSLLTGDVTPKCMTKNIHWMFPKHLLCSRPYAGGWTFEDEWNSLFPVPITLSWDGKTRTHKIAAESRPDRCHIRALSRVL